MTAAAIASASDRRRAALPGSPYDKLVSVVKLALPAAAVGVFATCLIWPLTARQEFSFILNKDKVAVAEERLRVQRAQYRGEDKKGQPFAISAGSAVQKSSDVPIVELKDIAATLTEADGPVRATAEAGRYDIENDTITALGPVNIDSADGSMIRTRDVSVNMATRIVSGESGVNGRLPLGTFRADRLRADISVRVVTLTGRVRLHIVQRRA